MSAMNYPWRGKVHSVAVVRPIEGYSEPPMTSVVVVLDDQDGNIRDRHGMVMVYMPTTDAPTPGTEVEVHIWPKGTKR